MTPDPPIVLPRPNLGPEPWPAGPAWPWLLAIGLGLILIVALLRRRARRRRQATPGGSLSPSDPVPAVTEPPQSGPPSDPVREALARALGRTWRARTTEEVASSTEVVTRLGPEVAARLLDYLRSADLAKFSGLHPGHDADPADLVRLVEARGKAE